LLPASKELALRELKKTAHLVLEETRVGTRN
jgi:hypothetical protein